MRKLLLVLVVFFSNSIFATDIPNFPFLLVKGEAETKVKPDIAKISFSVTEFNKDPIVVATLISKRGQFIVSLAAKLGISTEQIHSSEYSKSTMRKKDEQYQNLEILGYEVTQSFTVDIHNISLYSPFADQLMALPNIANIRTDFDVSNREQIDTSLLKQATKNAKKKADDLTEGMGVKVGSVYAVTQDYSFSSFEAVFGSPEYTSRNAPPDFVPPPSFDFVPDETGSNMFTPKTIEIKKSVSVVYKIKP